MYRVTSVGAPPSLFVCNIREDRVRGGWSMIRVIPPLLSSGRQSARRQIRAKTNAFVSGEPVNWIITNGGSFISAAVRWRRSGPRTAAVAVTRTPSGNSWADCCLYLYRLTDRLTADHGEVPQLVFVVKPFVEDSDIHKSWEWLSHSIILCRGIFMNIWSCVGF